MMDYHFPSAPNTLLGSVLPGTRLTHNPKPLVAEGGSEHKGFINPIYLWNALVQHRYKLGEVCQSIGDLDCGVGPLRNIGKRGTPDPKWDPELHGAKKNRG